jgi:hypothetical protein
MPNWRKIGPVTVRSYTGKVTVHNNLPDAVSSVHHRYIEGLRYGKLGWEKKPYCFRDKPWTGGDSHVFYDEMGLVIPVWRVQEAYRHLPREAPYRHRFRGFKRTAGHYHRHPRTQQERRENAEYGRGRRLNTPTSWDDLHIAARENRNWKQFRSTQYKTKR